MKPIACITGASSGIGRATAIVLAENGFDLVLCGRRQDRLKSLVSEVGPKAETRTLLFDVRNREAVTKAFASLDGRFREISLLINNAGNAHGLSEVHNGNLDDYDAMIDGNVKGLLYVSHAVIPGMVERRIGQVVNISSVAGKMTYPNGAVYCASKKGVEAISEGMRMDLAKYGIRVTNIAPGAVETEFSLVRYKGDKEKSTKVYEGYKALDAKDIANAIAFAVTAPLHVNIADMTIYPSVQAAPGMMFKEAWPPGKK